MIDPLLLTATRVLTFEQQRPLTNASGFFFKRAEQLFLVTSRHVLIDEPTEHYRIVSRSNCTSTRKTWPDP